MLKGNLLEVPVWLRRKPFMVIFAEVKGFELKQRIVQEQEFGLLRMEEQNDI